VKKSSGDQAYEELIVPGSNFAREGQGIFAGSPADQIVSHVLEGREIGGSVRTRHSVARNSSTFGPKKQPGLARERSC
jgi:hypothetical protein